MLPHARAPRLLVPRRLRWQACRTNSTAVDTKRYREESPTLVADRHKLPTLRPPEQSAYVRTGRFLKSPLQAFAVIRAVERKYGAVNEYYIAKDFEVETRYQSIIHLQFKDAESFSRLPTNTSNIFHVATPETLERPGGVGLDELEPFLERQEYAEMVPIPAFGSVMNSVLQDGRDDTKETNVMECKIARSKRPFWTPSSSPPALTSARDMTGRNFIKWGGFQTMRPIEKGTPILDEELFGPTSLDHVRMRRTLRKWSALSGAPNPYEYSEKSDTLPQDHQPILASAQDDRAHTIVKEAQSDLPTWEPLPEYESEPEDASMPSTFPRNAAPTRLARDAASLTPCRPHPSADAPEMPPPSQKMGHIRREDRSDLLTPTQLRISTPTKDNPPSTPHPSSTNDTTTPSPRAEKAAQLKAARAAANLNKTPSKKLQRKPPVKGPQPLPKKLRPTPEPLVHEEIQKDGVTARLKGLFGF